jgi:hypothetical protein
MFQNIPYELREFVQWVCWRYEVQGGRKTKVPYSPNGQHKANVHNPHTWGTFNEAVAGSTQNHMDGIGFMLTEADPYTGIDIDDKLENPASDRERETHQRILERFVSYTERSVGGRGYHIIIRGKISGGGGRDRGHVGVYSTQRYLTFSGLVVRNAPIVDCQPLLDQLIAQMPAGASDELYDIEGVLEDDEVHEMALNAANGEKYDALCKGDWAGMGYPSQSEADLALISILCYYTRDNAQVRRLFRYSALGRREKAVANDGHINRTIKRARSTEPAVADYKAAERAAQSILSQAAPTPPAPVHTPLAQAPAVAIPSLPSVPAAPHAVAHTPAANPAPGTLAGLSLPPGLVGELAQYLYGAAVRPVPEIALCTAIGLLAGIVGRSYNISGTGLNHYILFVGKTGVGKEGIATGVSKMIMAARSLVPMAEDFMGPSAFASGQGLIRTLDKKPCFVSVLGEFGLTLQALSERNAPGPQKILRKVLLDLYGKSGWEHMLQSTAYSDLEKNTKTIRSPNVTILAESTPETFFDCIDASDIADGLIPRFHIVEYKGPRTPSNPNAGQPPSGALLQGFANMVSVAATTQQNHSHCVVHVAPEAEQLLHAFNLLADSNINGNTNEGERQLWNRAHLKALKLAGLLAVGVNPHAPVVDATCAQWAIEFTQRGTEVLLRRFFEGEVGKGEPRQTADLQRIIREYFKCDRKWLDAYKVDYAWKEAGVVPHRYLAIRTAKLTSFYSDRLGAARALKVALEVMEQSGTLNKLSPQEAATKFGARQTLYVLGEGW